MTKTLRWIQSFLLILGLTLFSTLTFAACDYSFTVAHDAPNERIGDDETVYIPITITKSSTKKRCKSHIYAYTVNEPSLTFNSNNDSFSANVVRKNRNSWNESTENGLKVWQINNVSKPKSFYAKMDVSNQTIAGNYVAYLEFKIFEGNDEMYSQYLTINYTIDAVLSASVQDYDSSVMQGSAGSYQIELGTLVKDLSTNWNISVTSNAHFGMTIDSDNGGLKHSNSLDVIDYKLAVDGQIFNSQDMHYSHEFVIQDPQAESIIPIILTVGDVDFKMAGRYEDIFTVTISAN